jgi:hypothetical protein
MIQIRPGHAVEGLLKSDNSTAVAGKSLVGLIRQGEVYWIDFGLVGGHLRWN